MGNYRLGSDELNIHRLGLDIRLGKVFSPTFVPFALPLIIDSNLDKFPNSEKSYFTYL